MTGLMMLTIFLHVCHYIAVCETFVYAIFSRVESKHFCTLTTLFIGGSKGVVVGYSKLIFFAENSDSVQSILFEYVTAYLSQSNL